MQMDDARFKVTYSPEGIEPKVWEVDARKIKASELIALKKATDGAISGLIPLVVGLMDMDGEALKGLLWLLLKREMATVPWSGLDFDFGELDIENVGEEISEGKLRARLEKLRDQGAINAIGQAKLDELVARGVEPEREPEDPKAT